VADVYAGKKTAVLQPEKVDTSVRFFTRPFIGHIQATNSGCTHYMAVL